MKDLQSTPGTDSDRLLDGDDLDLVPEALKDLTVAVGQARQIRGGPTTGRPDCECGTA